VNITFKNKKLEKLANDMKHCRRELGANGAKVFQKRLQALLFAETLEYVRNMPGRFHELKNDRKGQWACDLEQPNRLVFIPHEDPIPENEHGQYIWLEIKGVEIQEIVNYHKEK
jgi:proteic killer suppression protein